MFFLHKWKKNLESDIDCMEESMQPYIALFYAFRKIRHDFANYVQTLQLFAETENYDEKKEIKKGILDQIGRFYECMPDTVPLFPPMPAKATRNTQLGLLYETWSEIRREMEKLPDTIRGMLEPLQKLQDQMERSLDPDESETEALLWGLDQFRSLPTEETSALSVLMDLCMQEAEQNSCLLRYKICQPTCFQIAYPDMLLYTGSCFCWHFPAQDSPGEKRICHLRLSGFAVRKNLICGICIWNFRIRRMGRIVCCRCRRHKCIAASKNFQKLISCS